MFDTPAKGAYLHSPEEPTIPTGSCSSYKKEHASSIQFKQTSEQQSMGGSTGENFHLLYLEMPSLPISASSLDMTAYSDT